jgi:hypothetical protein
LTVSDEVRKIANRHAARLLGKLEQVHDLSELAKDEIKREMHYLVEDVVKSLEGANDPDDFQNQARS